MSEWLSPTFAVILLALKVVGLIGAFVGFGAESFGGKSARKRTVALAFLGMAILAELVDSGLKWLDSREQAVRFERLAHPMGTIQITPLIAISLKGNELAGYRERLEKGRVFLKPDESEAEARGLLGAGAFATFFLFPHPRRIPPGDDEQPGLSFQFYLPGLLLQQSPATQAEERAAYSYDDGMIHAKFPTVSNRPDDRFSDGSVVSTLDLLGSLVAIRLCPMVSLARSDPSKETALNRQITLESFYLNFPGRQAIFISTLSDKKVGKASEGPCSVVYYALPKTQEEFKAILVP